MGSSSTERAPAGTAGTAHPNRIKAQGHVAQWESARFTRSAPLAENALIASVHRGFPRLAGVSDAAGSGSIRRGLGSDIGLLPKRTDALRAGQPAMNMSGPRVMMLLCLQL
jgi:hypothetical protein